MKFAKRSLAFNRVYNRFFKFDYFKMFVASIARHGKRKFALSLVRDLIVLLKRYFCLKIKKVARRVRGQPFNYLLFFNRFFDLYRPRVSIVVRKVAAKVYSLPWYITINRSRALLVNWIIRSARLRIERTMCLRVFSEIVDLSRGYGRTVKRLEEHYKLAVSNRPFIRMLRRKNRVRASRLKKFPK